MSLHVNHLLKDAYKLPTLKVLSGNLRSILVDVHRLETSYGVRGFSVLGELSASVRNASELQGLRSGKSENFIRANKQSALAMHVGALYMRLIDSSTPTLSGVTKVGEDFLPNIAAVLSILKRFQSPLAPVHPAFFTFPIVVFGMFLTRAIHMCLLPHSEAASVTPAIPYRDSVLCFQEAIDLVKARVARIGVQWKWDSAVHDTVKVCLAFEKVFPFGMVRDPTVVQRIQSTWDSEIGDDDLKVPTEEYPALFEDVEEIQWVAQAKRLVPQSDWKLGMRDLAYGCYMATRFVAKPEEGITSSAVDEFIGYVDANHTRLVRLSQLQSALSLYYTMILPFSEDESQRITESLPGSHHIDEFKPLIVERVADLLTAILVLGAIVNEGGALFKTIHVGFWASRAINGKSVAPFVTACEECQNLTSEDRG